MRRLWLRRIRRTLPCERKNGPRYDPSALLYVGTLCRVPGATAMALSRMSGHQACALGLPKASGVCVGGGGGGGGRRALARSRSRTTSNWRGSRVVGFAPSRRLCGFWILRSSFKPMAKAVTVDASVPPLMLAVLWTHQVAGHRAPPPLPRA